MAAQKLLLLLVISLFGVYLWSLQTGFYWRHPWLDLPLHFLGGAVVALFWVVVFQSELAKMSGPSRLIFLLGATALVGVLWEFFEWALDLTLFHHLISQATLRDTLGDLAMDLMGGLLITLFFFKKLPGNQLLGSLASK